MPSKNRRKEKVTKLRKRDPWTEIIARENFARRMEAISHYADDIEARCKYYSSHDWYLSDSYLPDEMFHRVQSMETLHVVAIAVRITNPTLAKIRTKALMTETSIKFIPVAIITLLAVLIGAVISSTITLLTFGIFSATILTVMLSTLVVLYKYHNRFMAGIQLCEAYLKLLEKRGEKINISMDKGKVVGEKTDEKDDKKGKMGSAV